VAVRILGPPGKRARETKFQALTLSMELFERDTCSAPWSSPTQPGPPPGGLIGTTIMALICTKTPPKKNNTKYEKEFD